MQGAPKKVLGLEVSDVTEEMQVIDGIVVQPSLGCCVEEEEQSIKMESWKTPTSGKIYKFIYRLHICVQKSLN